MHQVRVSLPTNDFVPLGTFEPQPDYRSLPAPIQPAEPFLLRITEVIEAHLDDGDLCSGNLHRFVPTSRATLHRLLQKYAGLSASDYLNLYRVHRSLDFLQSARHSISEVAASVGMNNSAYTRAFKTVFGQTPSEFRKG